MKKAIIFDVDGVMLDSEPHFATSRKSLLDKHGLSAPLGGSINGSGMLAFWKSTLAANNNSSLSATALARENFDRCLDGVVSAKLRETDGLTHLLTALAKKYALAVGSSSDRFYIEFVLKYLGVRQFFDITVCGDEAANAKPSPDIYLKVLELLHLSADECFVIEDSDNGIKAAVGAHIPCLALSLVNPPTQTFAGCYRKFDSLAQIEQFLLDEE